MEKPESLFILLLFSFLTQQAGATNVQACSYGVTGNNLVYTINNTCASQQLSFLQNATNNKVVCGALGPRISSVVFGQNSYNNTIINCTFANAKILSQHNALNNLISPYANYSLSFADNTSNIALGHYFTFVPRDINGNVVGEFFASISPFALASSDFSLINNQQITRSALYSLANGTNYTLPRFGEYLPTNSSGPISFALESQQISKNRTISFNPYWFLCPDWAYDILSYHEFNITSNLAYTPLYLSPRFTEDIQLPDSSRIYWNFSVRNYSGARNITAYVFSGYQYEPPKTVATIKNFTGDRLSYYVGVQKPGIYQFIAELRSSHDKVYDQSNSTSVNYAVGLAFCTQQNPPIMMPGYYSMSSNSLNPLITFTTANRTCSYSLRIESSNVTIDCRGGTINSTNRTVQVISSNNVVLKNCRLLGNAIQAKNSQLTIINSSIVANGPGDVAFSEDGSTIYLSNTVVSGYLNYFTTSNSSVTALTPNSITLNNPPLVINSATTTIVASGTKTVTNAYPPAAFLVLVGILLAACLLLFWKRRGKVKNGFLPRFRR